MRRFAEIIETINWQNIKEDINSKSQQDVESALHKQSRNLEDFKALLSPAADSYLEHMARLSHERTAKRFGKTIQLFIPLYLSNYCENNCVYCGFNYKNKIRRKKLTKQELLEEVEYIKNKGFQNILLLTGESGVSGPDYIKNMVKLLKPCFSQISLEIQPLQQSDYEQLIAEGVNSVYLYQETYNQNNYQNYHSGPKADFKNRLDTYEKLGKAGIYKIGLGVLLGLEDWRVDSFFLGLHLKYLQQRYWRSKYSISFPRLRPHEGNFIPKYHVSDRNLLQLICAYRLLDEDVEITLSTRENPIFRDNAIPLGVTCMSAGSSTEPAGYSNPNKHLKQFEINDGRSPDEIVTAIRNQGYQPVWKDWEHCLQEPNTYHFNP